MLAFGKWFSALLLTSRFNFLWSNSIFLSEFRAGKKPSYTRADHLYILSCLQKLIGVIPSYSQNDTGWEQMLSVGHADILGEGTAVSGLLFGDWLPWVSDHWCLWWELFCLLCTAESIWQQVTDPEKSCIPLEIFYAWKIDNFWFSILLVGYQKSCVYFTVLSWFLILWYHNPITNKLLVFVLVCVKFLSSLESEIEV